MNDKEIPERWLDEYAIALNRSTEMSGTIQQCIEELGRAEAALSEMTHDRDLWASDHEEDCPNLTLLDLSRDENTELKAQVAQLQATICTLREFL